MDIRSKDSSDEDHRRRKKTVADKRKKKRRYSSTDSSSSDESSSDTYSSDSDSYSDSSDTSSSSDHRHKRRKRTSRKDKYRHGKKKEPKRQRGKKRKSISKSKLGPEPPSNSESESTSSTNSESKKSDHQGKQSKNNRPMKAAGPSTRAAIMHKKKEGPSGEEGEVLRVNDVTKDDQYLEAKSDKILTKSNRSPIENSKENRNESPVSKEPASPEDKQTNHSKSLARGDPGYEMSEPTLKQGQDDSRNDSLNGAPKRIRKGRGFTEKYHYVRKYRSPSPERTSIQANYYRGRNEYRRDWNRYPNPRQRNYTEHGSGWRNYNEHSPTRVYRGSPRASASDRNRSRRAHSRSISRSPVRYHGQRDASRSPRTRRSTLHHHGAAGDRHQSIHELGGRFNNAGRGRSKSRSRSGGSTSKSPDQAGKVNDGNKRNRKSRSSSRSSSPGNNGLDNGLVSYGDGSPDS